MAETQTRPRACLSGNPRPTLQEGKGWFSWKLRHPGSEPGQVGLNTLLHLPPWAGGERKLQECFAQSQSLPLLRRHYAVPGLQRSQTLKNEDVQAIILSVSPESKLPRSLQSRKSSNVTE